MNDVQSSLEKDKPGVTSEAHRGVTDRMHSGTAGPRRNQLVALIAILAVVVATVLVLSVWKFRSSRGAGQPVPAPRTVATNQPSGSSEIGMDASHGATIAIAPEALASSGIKFELVRNEPASGNVATTSTGVVKANSYHESPVVSLLTGIVREVNVELGQHVKKDQELALIFSDELGLAQTRYLAAVAMLDEHHKHHRRTTSLVEVGAASREELEQATTKLRSSELEVASLRQRLVLLGLSSARINGLNASIPVRSDVDLVAPISGTVISRSINPGEIVQANTEVLRLADLSSVWVIAQVYEKDLASIRVGSTASVTSSAYPGRALRGKITYVDPNLDPATRTAQVRIEMANPGEKLKIGMYVDVSLGTNRASTLTVPFVPAIAVQNLNNQQIVFVATAAPGVYLLRSVRIGAESNGRVPVLEGLTAGERVVTEGSFLLRAEWIKLHPGS